MSDINPDEHYERLTRAYREQRWQEVIEQARPLRSWLAVGGTPFEGHSLRTARDLVETLTYDAMTRQQIERRRDRVRWN